MTLLHPTDAARSFPGFAPLGEAKSGQALRQRTARPLSEERLTDMSKRTDKLGYVAPQPQPTIAGPSASAVAVSELQKVNTQVDAWYAAHEGAATIPSEVRAELNALGYTAARDRVFATPALTPQDLAAKIATIWELSSDIEWHPARDDHREIVAKGGDADHALLACYLDALSLGGAVPNLSPVPADFGALIEDLRSAALEWSREADRTDEVKAEKEGRRVTAKDERIWAAASQRHDNALAALIDYRPTTAQEMALKAGVITENSDSYFRAVEYDFGRIYQRDAEHLARIEAAATIIKGGADRQKWDAAFKAWQDASATHDANCAALKGPFTEKERASLDLVFATRDALLDAFAPDASALADKLTLLPYFCEDFGTMIGLDTYDEIVRHGHREDIALLNCFENAKALSTGATWVAPFNPGAWVDDLERRAGVTLAANAARELSGSQHWGESPPAVGGLAQAQAEVQRLTSSQRNAVCAYLARAGGDK